MKTRDFLGQEISSEEEAVLFDASGGQPRASIP